MDSIVFILLLGYLTKIAQCLECHVCGYSSFPSTQQNSHYLSASFHTTCEYLNSPGEKHIQRCNDTENSCAGIHFVDKENNGFTLRTCLPLYMIRLQNACATFARNSEKIISKQFLAKLFNVHVDQTVSIKYCSCNTEGCDPFRQTLKYENIKGNNYSLQTVIAIFNNSTISRHIALASGSYTTLNATNSMNTAAFPSNASSEPIQDNSRGPDFPLSSSTPKSLTFSYYDEPKYQTLNSTTLKSITSTQNKASSNFQAASTSPLITLTSVQDKQNVYTQPTTKIFYTVNSTIKTSSTMNDGFFNLSTPKPDSESLSFHTNKQTIQSNTFDSQSASTKFPLFITILIPCAASLLILVATLVVLCQQHHYYSRRLAQEQAITIVV